MYASVNVIRNIFQIFIVNIFPVLFMPYILKNIYFIKLETIQLSSSIFPFFLLSSTVSLISHFQSSAHYSIHLQKSYFTFPARYYITTCISPFLSFFLFLDRIFFLFCWFLMKSAEIFLVQTTSPNSIFSGWGVLL